MARCWVGDPRVEDRAPVTDGAAVDRRPGRGPVPRPRPPHRTEQAADLPARGSAPDGAD